MRLLLDTHVAIWAVAALDRLSPSTQALIEDPGSDVYVSMCSLWEIAVKAALGRRALAPISVPDALAHFQRAGFGLLEITTEHIFAVADLPPLHGDPFDRLLVAQAICEPLRLLTRDKALAGYSDTIIVW